MAYFCPKSIKAYVMRITTENECGTPLDPLTPNARMVTDGFMKANFSPDIEGGADVTTKLASGAICIRDKDMDRLKGFNTELTLCGISLPAMSLLLGITMFEDPDDAGEFIGGVLRDSLEISQADIAPLMLEFWSKNSNLAQCGVGGTGSQAYMQWLLPFTNNWEITGDITLAEDATVDLVLTGYAQRNPNWFPSMPGPTFPSYVPGGGDPEGVPTGAAPTVLPPGIDADRWSLAHQTAIQAGGPLAWIAAATLPDTEQCEFMSVTGS